MVIVLVLAVGVTVMGLVRGCGKPSFTASGRQDAKSLLKEQPVNKPEFEKAVLGRSTREITELLGPPAQVLNWEKRTGWIYRIRPPDRPWVTLFFRDDRVVEVEWVDD